MSAAERFLAKVDVTPGCWLWTASLDGWGYGMFWVNGGTCRAHRFSYEFHVGPIPDGLQLDHLCRTPACVNPAHLEPVTGRVNVLRGTGFAPRNLAKTHCPAGHEYAGENLYIDPRGCRYCRECARQREGLRNRPAQRRRPREVES